MPVNDGGVPVTDTDELVWQRLNTKMPRHSCGNRMEPGGLGDTPVMVCVPCTYVEEIDPDAAADLAAEARAEVSR